MVLPPPRAPPNKMSPIGHVSSKVCGPGCGASRTVGAGFPVVAVDDAKCLPLQFAAFPC
jgi:hypothetical protein